MKHVVLECYDRVIGCAWFCVNDDHNSPEYCDECEDCDCTPLADPQSKQMEMFNE